MPVGRRTRKAIAKITGAAQCHPRIKGKQQCLPGSVYRAVGGRTRKEALRKSGCSSDRCIAEKASLSSKTIAQYLRPKKPAAWSTKPDTWLDTNNIDDVMRQYEEAYPRFQYLGAVPIDFSAPDPYSGNAVASPKQKCLYSYFCNINLADAKKKGKTGIGAVFNLDPHFRDGSHWVALFVDLARGEVNFFDSYGVRPHPLIFNLMKSLTLQMPLTLNYNARRFQRSNTECGMYSIYFLIKMIEGVPFKKFVRGVVADAEMIRLRGVLFSE
jgi:hypothetical protein